MSSEMAVIFQGISAGAAIVNAVKSALDIRKLSREEVLEIASQADQESKSKGLAAADAGNEIEGLDPEMEKALQDKVECARKEWIKRISDPNSDSADYAAATDTYRSMQCALMRSIKQICGGTLPRRWYKLWADLQCG